MRALALRPRIGLAGRAFLTTAGVVLVVLVVGLLVAAAAARRDAELAARRGLEQAADLTAQLLAGRGRSLAGGARVFVQGPYFRALVAERRRDDILDQAFEAADQLEADWVFITDERGALLAKSDEPGVAGDDLGRLPLVAGALGGQQMSGFGVSRDSLLFQTVAVPIVVPGAAPIGTLVATRIVDAQVARDVRAATASDVVFFTFDAQGRPHVSSATLRPPRAAAVLAPALRGGTIRDEDAAPPLVTVGATSYVTQRAAVATAGGDVVGGFVVLRARDTTPPGMTGLLLSFGAAAVIGLLLALLVARSAARRVARPARALAGAAAGALRGEYERSARESAGVVRTSRDELAALAAALAALIAELRDRQALAAALERVDAPTSTVEAGATARPAPEAGGGRAMTIGRGTPLRRDRKAAAALPREAPDLGSVLRSGEVLAGRYVVESELGAGGNGTVFRVRDLVLGELVALKRLRPELLAAEPLAAGRLAHALRLAQRIQHRNVVRIHDVGESAGVPFIAMELVAGSSIATLLRARGPLPEPVVIALAAQLARALEAAHAQGVVHGDLKPANLLVDRHGQLKVSDFGVAAVLRHAVADRGDRAGPEAAGARRQLKGALIGTPEYLAPEVLLGEAPHVRGDLYAAGVVLHECLTGSTPFHADSPGEFLARKLAPPAAGDASDPDRAAVSPRSLAGIIACLTATDRDARPVSAAAFGALVAALD